MSQVLFASKHASAASFPVYSTYTLTDYLNLAGVKLGQFGLDINDSKIVFGETEQISQSSTSKYLNIFQPLVKILESKKSDNHNLIVNTTPSTQASSQTVTSPTDTPNVEQTATPTTEPTVTPTPVAIPNGNLVENPSFEDTENNWAAKWTKDSDFFSLDTNSQGNNGTNSIHYASLTSLTEPHLFSEE
jgi:hypothetical protein